MTNSKLEGTYNVASDTIYRIARQHERAEDTIRYIRFTFDLQAQEANLPNPLRRPLDDLLAHVELMHNLLIAYHAAVGDAVREEKRKLALSPLESKNND